MRWLFLVLFLITAPAESRAGLFLVVGDADADDSPTIVDPQEALQLGVLNTRGSAVTLLNVQASLSIVPEMGAIGEVTLDIGQPPMSLFTPPLSQPPTTDGGVVTASVGTLSPAGDSLSAGQIGGLFSLTLTPSPDAVGAFQVVASGVTNDPLNQIPSTHFISPPDFLVLRPFDNTVLAPGGQVLLATVEFPAVPEPSVILLMVGGLFGFPARRRALD